MFDCVKNENWNRFAFDFEKKKFEIYEIINKKWINENVHDVIENFNRHLLKMKKIFDDIKNKYYELCENMTNWFSKKRFFIFDRWLNQLNNFIDFIRQKKTQTTILKLHKKTTKLFEKKLIFRKRRRNIDDDEKKTKK